MPSGVKKTLILTAVPLISPEKICPCFLTTNNCSGFTLKVKSCSLINWLGCFRQCCQNLYLAKCSINIHICLCATVCWLLLSLHSNRAQAEKLQSCQLLVCVWVSSLSSPGAFSGSRLGSSIQLMPAPSPHPGKQSKALSDPGDLLSLH